MNSTSRNFLCIQNYWTNLAHGGIDHFKVVIRSSRIATTVKTDGKYKQWLPEQETKCELKVSDRWKDQNCPYFKNSPHTFFRRKMQNLVLFFVCVILWHNTNLILLYLFSGSVGITQDSSDIVLPLCTLIPTSTVQDCLRVTWHTSVSCWPHKHQVFTTTCYFVCVEAPSRPSQPEYHKLSLNDPPMYKRYSPGCLEQALRDLQTGHFRSIRACARHHGIPMTTLRYRAKGLTKRPSWMQWCPPSLTVHTA